MPENGSPGKEQQNQLKFLYPWYKEEVFRRRERMMSLTANASGVLVLVLVIVQVFPAPPTSPTTAVLVCLGVVWAWMRDVSVGIYLAGLAGLTSLVIAAVLLR